MDLAGTFGFLSPTGLLWGIPVVAGLLYAYLRKKKLPLIMVPSLFLLKDLAQSATTRRRFFPPLRFWLELLIFLLLLLCVAGAFSAKESNRYALVVDNSLSTAARRDGVTLLEEEILDLTRTVGDLPSGSLFDLYVTSPRLERVGGSDISAAATIVLAHDLRPVFARDRIADGLSQVAQRESYHGIIAFTDRPISIADDSDKPSTGISIHRTQATTLANIALSDFQLRTGALEVAVRSFGNKQKLAGRVAFEGWEANAGWSRIGEMPISNALAEAITVKLSLSKNSFSAFRAILTEPQAGGLTNALVEDDVAYLSPLQTNRTVQVFSLRTLAELGLKKIRGTTFVQQPIEHYSTVLSAHPLDTFLFIDYLPNGLPGRNSIIISPPHGTDGFEIGSIVPQAEVASWDSGNPLLTYIDVASLRLSRFIPLRPPLWGASVISTVIGSVLVAGERGENRFVVAGFDLFPYRGKGTLTQSVLFLNMLKWITGAGSGAVAPYDPIPIPSNVQIVSQRSAEGVATEIPLSPETRFFYPEQPGIYQFELADHSVQMSVVNFTDSTESQLSTAEHIVEISSLAFRPAGSAIETKMVFRDQLIPLLLVILLIDLLILTIRSFRRFNRAPLVSAMGSQ